MRNRTSNQIGASSPTSRSRAWTPRWRFSSCPNPSILYRPCRPSARGVADGSRCRLCVRHHALLHWSTRVRCPSGAPLFHLYSQSRAAWPYPLTRIRDLPWPRFASSRPGSTLVTTQRWRPRSAADREPNQCNRGATTQAGQSPKSLRDCDLEA